MNTYDHRAIEKKWQEFWAQNKIYTTPDEVPGKDNFYLLVEFPYPSGNLHVGHWYAFAVPDILARYRRATGKNVLFPIGFDAFGLPAENAAIKRNLNPRTWTEENIAHMTEQIRSMGASFDWSRKVSTIDPNYYKWTQWLFLQLYKNGLVYRKETAVNWCPNDKTVLANEQVVNGTCERCGHEVEQRQMLQWNIKITDYADRLIDDLAPLDWPEQIKESQRNWIGRSEGAEIDFDIHFENDPKANEWRDDAGKSAHVTVFTTRPDTLFGATYLVLAPEHPWLAAALEQKSVLANDSEIQKYISQAGKKTELERQENKEKTGVELKGVRAINPATKEEMPMFVADYVLGGYGSGAIMAVPAHDERDFEFAQKFDLPIREVVMPRLPDPTNPHQPGKELIRRRTTINIVYDPKKDRYLTLRWITQPWITWVTGGVEKGEDVVESAVREITEETGYIDVKFIRSLGDAQAEFYAAHKGVNRTAHNTMLLFELVSEARSVVNEEETAQHEIDWIPASALLGTRFQHSEGEIIKERIHTGVNTYTGEGIVINSPGFDDLTSEEARAKITEKYGKPKKTYRLRDWVVSRQRYWGVPIPVIHCKKCGPVSVPDEQLPVILPDVEDYLPTGDGKSPLAKVASFVEATCPKCGGAGERETDTFDTFVDSSWYFLRYSDPQNPAAFASKEKLQAWMPVDLYSGGAEHTTMHVLYSRFWQKALYDLGLVADAEPYTRRMNRSLIMGPDGQKMSKSKGNVIDPDEVVERLGADTVRLYLAFIGPYNEVASYPWNPDGVTGVRRFLERVWRLGHAVHENPGAPEVDRALHQAIKKVTEDIPKLKFNTAIAALMTLVNVAEKYGISKGQFELFLRLLAPFAPHITEELWQGLGHSHSVHAKPWPEYDPSLLIEDEITYVVQIDGKTRGDVKVPAATDKRAVEAAARDAVAERLTGAKVERVVVVPNRLVNFVLAK